MERPRSPASPPASSVRYPLDLTDPQPLLHQGVFWRHVAQLATIGIFLIMFGALLDLARSILLPIVSAVVIGIILEPLARRATDYRIPAALFAAFVVGFIIVLFQLATVAVSGPIIEWIGRGGELGETLRSKLQVLDDGFAAFRKLLNALSLTGESVLRIDVAAVVKPMLGFLTPAIGQLLIFFATLFFYLLAWNDLRRNLVLVFDGQDARLRAIRILNDIECNLTRYIGTITVINLTLGAVTGLGAYLLDFSNPVILGVLAFACNYIPYLGPALVVVILFGVGLISFPTLGQAMIAPILFIAIATIEATSSRPSSSDTA